MSEAVSFERLVAYYREDANLLVGDRPQRVAVGYAAGPLLETLGVAPRLGRSFTAEEQKAELPVVLLGHEFWQHGFGGRADVIGASVNLSRKVYTVVGVLPPEARFPLAVDLWTPLPLGRPMFREDRWSRFLGVLGRLRPDVGPTAASVELTTLAGRLAGAHTETDAGWAPQLTPLQERLVGHTRPGLLLLSGATGLLLTLACLNVGALLFARFQARTGERAVRAALGANRIALLQPVLTEVLLLVLAGGALGVLLALGLGRLLVDGYAAVLPPGGVPLVDGAQFGFVLAALAGSALLTGLLPAWLSSRSDPAAVLGRLTARFTAGRGALRLRSTLVAAQIAGTLVLLAAAGLLGRSLHRLGAVSPGFAPEQVLTARLALPWERYGDAAAFHRDVLERADALPGVLAAGAINFLPFVTGSSPVAFQVAGTAEDKGRQTEFRCVSADYFRALGVPLRQGRAFTSADDDAAPRRVIVNETFVRRFLADAPPLGRTLQLDGHPHEIIGVVGDVRHEGFAVEPGPEVFQHHLQKPWPQMTLVIRAQGDPSALAAALRQAVSAVDGSQALFDVQPMAARLERSLAGRRTSFGLLGAFAGAALLLATLGIYGAIAQLVSLRTSELGVRLALGAQPAQVIRLVLGHGLKLAAVGVAAGLPLALLSGRLVRRQLYEIGPSDPLTLTAAALGLITVALLACWLPARRAARVDPMVALRNE